MSDDKRIIVVGDLHGCIDEFDELIKIISYNKRHDRIICLGDMIDRGPDSVGMIKKAREMDLECVMGNHEAKFLAWFKSSGSNTDVYDSKPYYKQFSDADITYINNMPPYIKLENTLIVHAGIRPGIALENQSKSDLLYIRYMDNDNKFVSLKKINKLGKEATYAHFWTEFGPFGYDIVYGHNVHSYENIKIDLFDDKTSCYGIDTGCCFGGRLSALILQTKEVIQVQAKQIYYKSKFNIR